MNLAIWVLVIKLGCSGLACTSINHIQYPNKESCYEALSHLRVGQAGELANNHSDQSIVFCMPKQEKE